MEYYGIISNKKLEVKIAVIIFIIYMFFSSIVNKTPNHFIFGLIISLTFIHRKKHIISDNGVDILYSILGIEFHNIWNWEDIESFQINFSNSKEKVEVYIRKNVIFRKFIFNESDIDKILKLVQNKNIKIQILRMESKV